MNKIHASLLAGLLMLPMVGQAQVSIHIDVPGLVTAPPPPPRIERRPGSRQGYVWVPGHWAWVQGDYRWREGSWARARPNYDYAPGQWVRAEGGWRWSEPRWQPREGRAVYRDSRPRRHDGEGRGDRERDDRPHGHRGHGHGHGPGPEHCPPGQAKKGRC